MSCWIIIILLLCCNSNRSNPCTNDRRDCADDCLGNAFSGNTVCGCEVSEPAAEPVPVAIPAETVYERVHPGRMG